MLAETSLEDFCREIFDLSEASDEREAFESILHRLASLVGRFWLASQSWTGAFGRNDAEVVIKDVASLVQPYSRLAPTVLQQTIQFKLQSAEFIPQLRELPIASTKNGVVIDVSIPT